MPELAEADGGPTIPSIAGSDFNGEEGMVKGEARKWRNRARIKDNEVSTGPQNNARGAAACRPVPVVARCLASLPRPPAGDPTCKTTYRRALIRDYEAYGDVPHSPR